mgnify:CR=1 FL=1
MAVSIDWGTGIITVPRADLTLLSSYSSGFSSGFGAAFGSFSPLYSYSIDTFRLALKDLEDSEAGMPFLNTHSHNTEVTLAGVTYARTVEIINGYTVTFEDGQYAVVLSGANSNVHAVANVNQVSVRPNNSAGLQTVSGSGLSTAQADMLEELHKIHGLLLGSPLTVTSTARAAGGVTQTVGEAAGTVTVTRT